MNRLNDAVEELLKRQYVLQITMEHLEEYRENMSGISLIDAFDTRYDSYFHEDSSDPAMDIWMKHIELFTQTVGIKKELLIQEPLPKKIPVQLGIGSYKGILMGYHKEHNYTIDSDTTAFLFRIDHSESQPRRIYRIRVKVI